MNLSSRPSFSVYFLLILMGFIVASPQHSNANTQVSAEQAKLQCVTNRALYAADVWWYDAKNVLIDNSEPWNNRLLIERSHKLGKGKCGYSLTTGQVVCQGGQVQPIKKQTITNTKNNNISCMKDTGDRFAVVWCKGCKQGSAALNAFSGTVAMAILPGNSAVKAFTGLANSIADSQGVGVNSGIDLAIGYRQPSVVSKDIPIHDFSDLPDAQNVVFAATPKSATLRGSFARPYATNNLSEDKGNSERTFKYTFQIDCYLSNGGLSHVKNTDTKDTITVDFYTAAGLQVSVAKKGKDIPCKAVGSDPSWHANVKGILTKLVVRTSGEDGFMIDQAKLFINNQGRLTRQLEFVGGGGSDNIYGWCLSKDPTDAHRSWKKNTKKCEAARTLKLKPHHL